MLDLLLLAAAFAGGYAVCIYSWPTVTVWSKGSFAEAINLRAKAQQLENKIRGR